jgi:hypothetical protein
MLDGGLDNWREHMLRKLVVASIVLLPLPAYANIPLVNATCGDGVEVHADEGGPVYINGKEAKLKKVNSNYYEARHGDVTISLAINPDGSPSLSATWKGGANGICTVKDGGGSGATEGCPADVSEADRYKYPACN